MGRRAGIPRVSAANWAVCSVLVLAGALLAAGCGWLQVAPVALPGPVRRPQATLTVRESLGLARDDWPMTAGVPFPAGAVPDASQLVITDDRGVSRPLQSRVLSRWPDGSVRWALLDWQANLQPHQESRYEVAAGTPLAAARRVKVVEWPDRIDVDTGPLQFSVPKGRFAWLQRVRLGHADILSGPISSMLEIDGRRVDGLMPDSVTVTESGPVRTRIEMRGHYAAAFDYVVRIDAYANEPFVRILHTFEQHSAEAYTLLQRMATTIPITLRGQPWYRAGQEQGPQFAGRLSANGFTLAQEDNETVRVGGQRQSGHAAGWVDIGDERHGVAVAAQFFWQQYPQSFELRPNGIRYNLFTPEGGPAKVGMGAAKTHEVLLYFHGRKPPPQITLTALTEPLLAWVDPEWTVASGALRNSVATSAVTPVFLNELGAAYRRYQTAAASEPWDDSGQASCADPAGGHLRHGFFGMLNWGDWNYPGYHDSSRGCDAWGNLEYDMTQVLALAYAASGERAYYDGMVAAARHSMDVDHISYQHERPDWVGMNHPGKPLHFDFEKGGVDLGRTWTEGLLSYYYLTGDERSLDAARGIADYLVRRADANVVRRSPRQWGWPQIALVAVYEATGDAKYRHAAEEYARRGMAAYAPHKITDWRWGVLAEGLAYTHSLSQDASIRRWLERYATAVNARQEPVDPRLLPGWAYAGRISGRAGSLRGARAAVGRLKFDGSGKSFTVAGRTGFVLLSSAVATPP